MWMSGIQRIRMKIYVDDGLLYEIVVEYPWYRMKRG